MLSICIPRYNYDPTNLIEQLRLQIKDNAEIIVIDDASNQELPAPPADQFIALNENVGRAAIRNLFLQYANFDWLLFLDNDVAIPDAQFLDRYLRLIKENTAQQQNNVVTYGGRVYSPILPDLQHRLRWNYGRKAESLSATEREKNPYFSFQTNNFLVHRSVLKETPFDITLRNYGYEDLLFALSLQKKKIPIIHIDNPVLNLHLESNERFLELTEMAMRNLKYIMKSHPQFQTGLTKFSRSYGPMVPGFVQKFLYNRLQSGKASVMEFQLWKAAVFHSINISYP